MRGEMQMQDIQEMPESPGRPWLREYRDKNLAVFLERPMKKSKYTSIANLEEILRPAASRLKAPVVKRQGGTVKIMGLEEAFSKMPEKMAMILSREEKPHDQFEAFANAYFNSGFVAIVSGQAGTVELEINVPEGACAKYFIIAEKGAKAGILEKIQYGGSAVLAETVYAEENSVVAIARRHGEKGVAITSQQCIAGKGAMVTNCNAWLGGSLVKGRTTNILDGEGASADECSMALSRGKQQFDIGYSSVHRGTETKSHCMFKSALMDESRMVFDGMIRIEPTGSKSNALLECHSMILGEKASCNQIPGLEIKTDDVKATHSATVARMEEEELFYLESRGLDHEEARKMVVKSFLESIVYKLPGQLREKMQACIESVID